jgi:transaldolase
MKATAKLNQLGQSLWLDNITRTMLGDGTLAGYIEELSVTGLTSNPTIFDKAISGGDTYDEQIAEVADAAEAGDGVGANAEERIFFELALADLGDATKLFAPVHERTDGVDGFCSLEVSPLIADDAEATIAEAAALHAKGQRDNLFIKIPGTKAGLTAIEESIFAGIPINVTLLFDDQQYLACADAYMRGVERRIEAGLNPAVASVASIFMSRWDVAVAEEVSDDLHNRLGIAIGGRAYRAYNELLACDRFRRLQNEGARAQRLLWASTGTKDPNASDTLYIEAFASPFTVNTMPEPTLHAFADHGEVGDLVPADGGNCELVLKEFADAGIDVAALAARLQEEGKQSFNKSWEELLQSIASQRGVAAG